MGCRVRGDGQAFVERLHVLRRVIAQLRRVVDQAGIGARILSEGLPRDARLCLIEDRVVYIYDAGNLRIRPLEPLGFRAEINDPPQAVLCDKHIQIPRRGLDERAAPDQSLFLYFPPTG